MSPHEVKAMILEIMNAIAHGRTTKSIADAAEERQLLSAVSSLSLLLAGKTDMSTFVVDEVTTIDGSEVSKILSQIAELMKKIVYLDIPVLLSGVTAGSFYDLEDFLDVQSQV